MAERATIVDLADEHLDDAAEPLAEAQRDVEPGPDPAREERLGILPTFYRLFRGIA